MMTHIRSRKLTALVIFTVPLLVFFYYLGIPGVPSPALQAPIAALTRQASGFHGENDVPHFWQDLLEVMVLAKPVANAITVQNGPPDEDIDPKFAHDGRPKIDNIHISEADRRGLKAAHGQFVSNLPALSSRLPYQKRTRGIVMTAGGKYMGIALTSLLMLRRSGSKLPVELFLDAAGDYNTHICDEQLPKLDAKCVIMEDFFRATPKMPTMKKYQFKVFSIIFSRFQDLLFLDADAFPIHNPDSVLRKEPFLSHGLVTWPDNWLLSASPIFYEVAGLEMPSRSERTTSESGVMLYDKARHAASLLLAAYYNFHGPDFYYPLLSQGAVGQGDKETFLHAAMALRLPFYDVKTKITFPGRWINGTFKTAAMKQADPGEDFALHRHAGGAGSGSRGSVLDEGESLQAKTLFVHHNLVKVNVRRIQDSLDKLLERNETGKLGRLWGEDKKFMVDAGYDVERAMWEEIIKTNCRSSWSEECERLMDYFNAVF